MLRRAEALCARAKYKNISLNFYVAKKAKRPTTVRPSVEHQHHHRSAITSAAAPFTSRSSAVGTSGNVSSSSNSSRSREHSQSRNVVLPVRVLCPNSPKDICSRARKNPLLKRRRRRRRCCAVASPPVSNDDPVRPERRHCCCRRPSVRRLS